jgi:CCR4-NOT transcription complex subunit 7/8
MAPLINKKKNIRKDFKRGINEILDIVNNNDIDNNEIKIDKDKIKDLVKNKINIVMEDSLIAQKRESIYSKENFNFEKNNVENNNFYLDISIKNDNLKKKSSYFSDSNDSYNINSRSSISPYRNNLNISNISKDSRKSFNSNNSKRKISTFSKRKEYEKSREINNNNKKNSKIIKVPDFDISDTQKINENNQEELTLSKINIINKNNNNNNYNNYNHKINDNNQKIKLNLNMFTLEELEYLDLMLNNKSIKIEDEEYSQIFKEFFTYKMQKIKSIMNIDIDISRNNSNLNLTNDNNDIIIEINDFKGLLSDIVYHKKEKEMEINSLKESLNYRKNIDRINKDLEQEIFELRKENEYLKKNFKEISKLNEILLRTYHNKLIEFGEFFNKLKTFFTIEED